MTLALFDFDGTITDSDTLLKFIRYMVGDYKFILGLFRLSPMLILYKLKLIPNYKAKQKMLSYFFKNYNEKLFKESATQFSLNNIDKILRPKAIDKIQWHKDRNHKIVIVSASIDCWLRPWCEKHHFKLIATKLEIKDNIVTGRFSTKNCYGIEKVKRIKDIYNLDEVEYIYAYGDSRGDKEMLEIANESFFKPF